MKRTSIYRAVFIVVCVYLCSCSAQQTRLQGNFLCETAPESMRVKGISQIVDVLTKMVASASKEIDIAALYLTHDPDPALMSALRSAIKKGVKVRMVLNDSDFSRKEIYTSGLDLEPDVELKFFNIAPYGHKPYGVLHAKYVIVDGRMALLGSANFSFAALHDNREENLFTTDTGVISSLKKIFELDMHLAGLSQPETNRSFFQGSAQGFNTNALETLCETAPWQFDDPSIPDFREVLETVVMSARSNIRGSIYLYTSAYTNDPFLEKAFFAAMDRGVKLELVVNHDTYWEKEKIFVTNNGGKESQSQWKYPDYRMAVDRIAAKGADIRFINPKKYLSLNKFSTAHSKYLIVDGHFLVLGSANWTASSMSENRETCVFTKDPALLAQAGVVFARDWKFSQEMRKKNQAK